MRIAALLLLLSGKPINEPIVVHGPFVMNTEAEGVEAIADLNSGKFGEIVRQLLCSRTQSRPFLLGNSRCKF
jgi:hypothetical protein